MYIIIGKHSNDKNLLNHTGRVAYFIIAMQRIIAERFILFVGTKILRLVDAGTH